MNGKRYSNVCMKQKILQVCLNDILINRILSYHIEFLYIIKRIFRKTYLT